MISRKLLREAKRQAKQSGALQEIKEERAAALSEDMPQLDRYQIRKENRKEGVVSFKRRRQSLKWEERKRRIREGIIRTEWKIEDGTLATIKEPLSQQTRLKAALKKEGLEPGMTGIIIETKDILPSSYGSSKDGKNKKVVVLFGAEIVEWDASWIEDAE